MKQLLKQLLCFTLALVLTLAAVPGPVAAQDAPDTDECKHVYEEIPGTRKDPTCTENGFARVRCKLCGYEEDHYINRPGHKYIPELDQENLFGEVTRYCERCEKKFKFRKSDYKDPDPEFLAADADHNGSITAADARLILRAAVGLETLA